MSKRYFSELITSQNSGNPRGITAVCSAHPTVLRTALVHSRETGQPVLIEATCNQVNQDGGYTGMRPQDFQNLVKRMAAEEGVPLSRIILGGDHLGPNPWRHLPATVAMDKAKAMMAAYATAGFTKIHLDASMSCADDPLRLSEDVIAKRAAALAAVAETHGGANDLAYIIGTEVPVPGGATEHVTDLVLTQAADAATTVDLHKTAFAALGIDAAFDRVVGLVVQPGVEFGHENVVGYNPEKAKALTASRVDLNLAFEAHSTDYQSPAALSALVRDGFAILKVGPWLTFAYREALYALDAIAAEMWGKSALKQDMEQLMLADDHHWASHYHGSPDAVRLQLHYSYSDRIRYYWAAKQAEKCVTNLFRHFGDTPIPETLISQYLGPIWPQVSAGTVQPIAASLVQANVTKVLKIYDAATQSA